MKIGIDARLVHYQPAGIGQYTLRLAQALAAMDKENTYVILQSRKDTAPLVDGVAVRRHSMLTPPHHRLEQWTLPLELRPLGLDLLHSPDFIPPFHFPRRSVITVHDLAFLRFPGLMTGDSHRYYGQIDKAVRRADQIIAVSESTKRDLVALVGADERKITCVYEYPSCYKPTLACARPGRAAASRRAWCWRAERAGSMRASSPFATNCT